MADNREIEEVLRGAQAAVEAAEVATEFRAIAYEKAVELLAARAGLVAPAGAASPGPQAPPPAARQTNETPAAGSLESIANRLGVDLALVEQAYEVQDGDLAVVMPASRLPQQARPAMRTLIMLTAVGRQAGGWDGSQTPVATLRAVCEHYGGRYFDAGNYANSVRDLDDYLRRTGGRRNATVRVLPAGYARGAELLRELFGEGT